MTRALQKAEDLRVPSNWRGSDIVCLCLGPARQANVVKNTHDVITLLKTDNVERRMGAQTFEEALPVVELADVPPVQVVRGHGEVLLSRGVRTFHLIIERLRYASVMTPLCLRYDSVMTPL